MESTHVVPSILTFTFDLFFLSLLAFWGPNGLFLGLGFLKYVFRVYSSSIGKTPEKVLGPKFFFWVGQEAVEVGPMENFSASKSGFFNFQLDFPP